MKKYLLIWTFSSLHFYLQVHAYRLFHGRIHRIYSPQVSGIMTVHFINVGMGESILIESPSGKTMLINAGDEDHGKVVSSYLKNISITSLDVVVASDPSDAFIGGMATILQDFNVKEFIDSGYSSDTRPDTSSTRMLSRIGAMKIPYRTVESGDTIAFDPAVTVYVLNPQTVFSKIDYENSVVLKMIYGNTSFLYMGHVTGKKREYHSRIRWACRYSQSWKFWG